MKDQTRDYLFDDEYLSCTDCGHSLHDDDAQPSKINAPCEGTEYDDCEGRYEVCEYDPDRFLPDPDARRDWIMNR